MAGHAANIYLSPAAKEALDSRASDNRSLAASRMIERYDELCRRALPELSEAEWNLVYDACRSWFVDTAASVRYVDIEVEDALTDGLADKWAVDGPALVAKLRALDYAGRCAAVDAVERYWSKS